MLASGTKGLLRLKHQMNFVLGQGPILSVCSNHSGKLPWDCCANAKTLMAQQLLKIWVQLWVRKTIDTTLCHHLQMIRHHALAAFFFSHGDLKVWKLQNVTDMMPEFRKYTTLGL